jgi:hypothetical protein
MIRPPASTASEFWPTGRVQIVRDRCGSSGRRYEGTGGGRMRGGRPDQEADVAVVDASDDLAEADGCPIGELNFDARIPRHSGGASVSFAYLPEVLDELRMSFRILDVEVGAQHSQPHGERLRSI